MRYQFSKDFLSATRDVPTAATVLLEAANIIKTPLDAVFHGIDIEAFPGETVESVLHRVDGHGPPESPDNVNHPAHYTASGLEPITAIEAWGLGFNLGNAVKYIARHRHKGGLEDLKKAAWYLSREITNAEQENAG